MEDHDFGFYGKGNENVTINSIEKHLNIVFEVPLKMLQTFLLIFDAFDMRVWYKDNFLLLYSSIFFV